MFKIRRKIPPFPALATADFFDAADGDVDVSTAGLAASIVLPSDASIKFETVRGLPTFDRKEFTRPIESGKAWVETSETIDGGSQPPKSPTVE